MVERAKPVMRAIKLTPPRPSARASSATNRRRLCSFNTGAICRYRLRAARACAARIMHPSYVARFLAVNPPHAFLRRLWQHRLSCLWTGPKPPRREQGRRKQGARPSLPLPHSRSENLELSPALRHQISRRLPFSAEDIKASYERIRNPPPGVVSLRQG